MMEIPHFPIVVPQKHSEAAFKILLSTIKPQWPPEKIIIKYFTKGTTNTIISASLVSVSPECSIDDTYYNHCTHPTVDAVLVRVYGNCTEALIDRTQEIQNMVAMWALGFGSQLYCTFENGLCYGYAPGVTVNIKSVRDLNVYPLIAKTLAQMHCAFRDRSSLPKVHKTVTSNSFAINNLDCCSQSLPQPSLFITMRKWADLLLPFLTHTNGECNNSTKASLISTYSHPKEHLLSQLPVDPWAEIEYLEDTLRPLKSPVVFCHNDLLLDNIIYNPDTGKVTFIDLEYGDFNYQAFDIAHFFCEFAGMEKVDYGLFPERAYRVEWLTVYWREWQALNRSQDAVQPEPDSPEERREIERLSAQVDRFTLAPHLYWAIWAILQSRVSDKTFDYFSYAKIRLTEYARIKADPSVLEI